MVFQMILPALIGAAGGLFGGMMQNSANAASVDKQMAFQAEQSSTQYQRGMQDMKAAGLNPMLAYQQGGASSASGAAYSATNVGEAALSGANSAVNSANASKMITEQIKNMSADTDLKRENAKMADASVSASLAQANLASQNAATSAALRPYQVGISMADEATARANAIMRSNDVAASNVMGEYIRSAPGKVARMLALGGTDAAAASSAVKFWK